MVFRVRYVAASLVSRRKVSRRFWCPNFTQHTYVQYKVWPSFPRQNLNIFASCVRRPGIRKYATHVAVRKNDVTLRKARREIQKGALKKELNLREVKLY